VNGYSARTFAMRAIFAQRRYVAANLRTELFGCIADRLEAHRDVTLAQLGHRKRFHQTSERCFISNARRLDPSGRGGRNLLQYPQTA
jgi:hypothetical protein